MVKAIEETLKCTIASDKAGLVATDRKLVQELRARIPRVSGPIAASIPNLGVDSRAAKPRGRLRKGTKRWSRLQKGMMRAGRLRVLAKVLGRRARTIFTVGVSPAVVYGAATHGLSDIEVRKLRRLATAATPPHTRLRSLTAALLLNKTPTAAAEVAPALQFSRMVWKAIIDPEQARMRRSGLVELRNWHESASRNFAPLAAVVKRTADRQGPICEPAVNEAWRRVRGPLAAAALALARIGWSWVTAFEWIDDRGVRIQLTANTPAAVARLLGDGHRRALERYVGSLRSARDPRYAGGRRVCADLAERFLEGPCPKGVTPLQRGVFRSAAHEALMTNSRANQAGYVIDNVCPLCGAVGDDVYHRVYRCPQTAEELERELPRWFLDEARASDSSNTFLTTGLFPHPADLWPLPSAEQLVMCAAGEHAEEGGGYEEAGLGSKTGYIFIDGTCTQSPIRGIARSASAAVEVDQQGELLREVTMLTPAGVVQTPQAGEHGGLLLAIGQLIVPTDLVTDCLGVQKAFVGDPVRAVSANRIHGATMLMTGADPQKRARVRSLQWVRAHRNLQDADGDRERWLIKGNAQADLAAKRAVRAHPQPSDEASAELDWYVRRFPFVARAIGLALSKFPPAPGNLARRPPPSTHQEARVRGCHCWEWDEGRWRCTECWAWCNRRVVPVNRRHQKCTGSRDCEEARAYVSKGHRMRAAVSSPPFLYCVRCGGASLRRAYKLRRPCAGPNAAGRQALARIKRGLHPWQELDGTTGKRRQRKRLDDDRAFDADAGNWLVDVGGEAVRGQMGRSLRTNSLGFFVKHKGAMYARNAAGKNGGGGRRPRCGRWMQDER